MNASNNGYFNLHADGFGYFQRVREVESKGGKSYVACDINSLQGPSKETKKLRFDLIVTGPSAQADVDFICDIMNEQQLVDPKILVAFRASDLELQFFTYQHGPNKGSQGSCIKARLIRLSYCSINGVVVQLPSAQAQGKGDESADLDALESQPSQPPVAPAPAPRLVSVPQVPVRSESRVPQAAVPEPRRSVPHLPIANPGRYPRAGRFR